jgi:predicted nucleotidyltransferase
MRKKRERMAESLPRRYGGANVPLRVIRAFARRIAERFRPDKIILFGSHAYGKPHADSDVDILVVMPARNELDQAFKIRLNVPAPFPMDLIVRTPKSMQWRLAESESFLTEIISRGKVLYEKDNPGVGPESRGGLRARQTRAPKQNAAS